MKRQIITIQGEMTDLNTYINAERTNRFQAAKIKNNETRKVWAECMSQHIKPYTKPVFIDYYWMCKDKRKDKSNIAFAKKFIEDGLIQAKVIPNDGWKDIAAYQDHFFLSDDPRVEVVIYEEGGEHNE